MRATWTSLSDSQLLEQCHVDTYRASGPGGQKRNKTNSAVRLRHPPSGLIVIAEESRSQHENRARALRRLRQALHLKIRDQLSPEACTSASLASHPDWRDVHDRNGRVNLGSKDSRFWPAAGLVLDVLETFQGQVRDTAAALGISTGNLIDFMKTSSKVWEQVNQMRARFGHKPLH
jgi:hypothetical protein